MLLCRYYYVLFVTITCNDMHFVLKLCNVSMYLSHICINFFLLCFVFPLLLLLCMIVAPEQIRNHTFFYQLKHF